MAENVPLQSLSEASLLDMLALLPQAVALYRGDDLEIAFASDQMLGYWGSDRSVYGTPLEIAVPFFKEQGLLAVLRKVFSSGESYTAGSVSLLLMDNNSLKNFVVDMHFRPVISQGQTIAVLHTLQKPLPGQTAPTGPADVMLATSQLAEMHQLNKRLNDQLFQSDFLFRSIFEQAPLGLTVLKGTDMVIEQANGPILKIWGRSADEVVGRPIAQARPELSGQTVLERLEKVYSSGESQVNVGYKVMLRQGDHLREAYVNSVYSPLRNNDGDIIGILVVVDDVTDRVIDRQKRELVEEQFRISVESADLGTWNVYSGTNEFVVSDRTKEMFGFYPSDQVSLEDLLAQVREDYRAGIAGKIAAAMAGDTAYDEEYPVLGRHDGKLRWLRATGRLYPASGGGSPHFSGVLSDVSRRRTEEERKYDFISIVSHELKTPLTSLKGYIQLLSRATKDTSGTVPLFLGKAGDQIEKMHALIRGFLDVARIDSKGIVLQKKIFSVDELLIDCAAEIALFSDKHQLVRDQSAGLMVNADREKIAQVIDNLLHNALKYSPDGGQIRYGCRKEAAGAVVWIRDDGIGIAPQDQEHLFSRFYRVENQSTHTISGFGIGLYLCSEIIRSHGGTIGVESIPGKGSTFHFSLPIG